MDFIKSLINFKERLISIILVGYSISKQFKTQWHMEILLLKKFFPTKVE